MISILFSRDYIISLPLNFPLFLNFIAYFHLFTHEHVTILVLVLCYYIFSDFSYELGLTILLMIQNRKTYFSVSIQLRIQHFLTLILILKIKTHTSPKPKTKVILLQQRCRRLCWPFVITQIPHVLHSWFFTKYKEFISHIDDCYELIILELCWFTNLDSHIFAYSFKYWLLPVSPIKTLVIFAHLTKKPYFYVHLCALIRVDAGKIYNIYIHNNSTNGLQRINLCSTHASVLWDYYLKSLFIK